MAEDGVTEALHIAQSDGLSPTIDNANKAIELVKEKYPNINYRALESKTTTIGEGMLVKLACRLRDY
jgi:fatty acid-binding protein DegV